MEAKQIMADKAFEASLQNIIDSYLKRGSNPETMLKPGMRYLRSPWDGLNEKGLLTNETLKKEFNLIVDKESKLPSSERNLVRTIVWEALKTASMKMQTQEMKEASRKAAESTQKRSKGEGKENVPGEEKNATESK